MKKIFVIIVLLCVSTPVLRSQDKKLIFDYHESLNKYIVTQIDKEFVEKVQLEDGFHLMNVTLLSLNRDGEILKKELLMESGNKNFDRLTLGLMGTTKGKWAVLEGVQNEDVYELIIPFVMSLPSSWGMQEREKFRELVAKGNNLKNEDFPELKDSRAEIYPTITNIVRFSSH